MICQTEPRIIRNTIEQKIIKTGLLEYIPGFQDYKDKGEAKTLSYAAAKGIHLFSSNDKMATHLILEAVKLKSGLDSLGMIYYYEFLYALSKDSNNKREFLRKLYKNLYFFTNSEQSDNPQWGNFVSSMDLLYSDWFLV